MHRHLLFGTALVAGLLAGCATSKVPTNATTLEPAIRKKVEKGVVEPGFTPEMVFMALGKPSEPKENLADATTNGSWVYRNFHRDDRDFVRAGFRRRVVFDPARRGDVVVTEPVDPRSFPNLEPNSVVITFREGRVVEIQRVAEL